MRILLAAAILPVLLVGNVAHAQMAVMSTPSATINATSPLGDGAGSPVSPPGIALGATEVTTGGVSPLDTPPDFRALEASYAEAWFRTITAQTFG